jgi:hypothetical protein
LLLIFVETHWDHPSLKESPAGLPDAKLPELQVCQNSLAAIMSCARVVLEFIVAGGQGLIRSKKQKAISKDGLIACYVWLPEQASNLRPAN